MLRPGGPAGAPGSGPGAVVGVPVPTACTADWIAACAQQAHTKWRLHGSMAAELCVAASEASDMATSADVAECWADDVAEAFIRRWLVWPEEPSKPCSSEEVTDRSPGQPQGRCIWWRPSTAVHASTHMSHTYLAQKVHWLLHNVETGTEHWTAYVQQLCNRR